MRCKSIILCLSTFLLVALPALAQQGPPDGVPGRGEEVRRGVSPPLRDVVPPAPTPREPQQIPNFVHFVPPGPGTKGAGFADVLRQSSAKPSGLTAKATPAPSLSFEGTSDADNGDLLGFFVVPPDTEGDVGPNHYVQMNNLVFEVFDKNGNTLLGPLPNNSLWSEFGGICEEDNDGDPIVLYDQGADRWVLSQFAIGNDGHQCVAVSQTGDPTGSYFLYDIVVSPTCFNDYPKMGLWTDGYYLTANEFCETNPGPFGLQFRSAIGAVFDRSSMLSGGPSNAVVADITTGAGTAFNAQPSHWEGPTAPASSSEHFFVQSWDDETWGSGSGSDGYRLWKVVPDFSGGSLSITEVGLVSSAEFDADLCGFSACVPQPGSGELLDTLSQFTMYRVMYRSFSGHETLLVSHTVDADGSDTAGVRWAELRNSGPGTAYALHQAGTYAPADGEHRWMSSIGMDATGNIAVAYSLSSTSTFPSIRYNTRLAGDSPGLLTGGEAECFAGSGAQVDSSNRWGDYSTVSVDPSDDCTFWLTNEYYETTASFDFKTRICAFTLPECTGGGCTPTEDPEVSCADGADNDCDGLTDSDDPDCCPDADGDGFTDAACGGTDCNDADATVNPGAAEVCDDLVDNDCDGLIDCDDGDCASDSACQTCLPVGSSCTSDAECCSNKCRGKAGSQTCK